MEVKKLWQPEERTIKNSNMKLYEEWLNRHYGLTFNGYHELWSWSVKEPAAFWESLWKYFEVSSSYFLSHRIIFIGNARSQMV